MLILLAALIGAGATPIYMGPETTPTIAHTLLWGIEPRADGTGLAERTLYAVIRSCVLTIAACVYRAIHQNIPDPKASWWERQRIRAKITFYAVMTPEAMVWWAMRQWVGAKEVADQINLVKTDLQWTRTHGHFAQMGGFVRLDDESVLHPPKLIELLKVGQIDVEELKRVSNKRINDSSKGDILSKGIIALQTTWFVFECLARLQQGLPLLELEVVTLAFAILNTLTYAFWWHKPLDVLCPVYLHIRPPSEASDTPESPPVNLPSPTSADVDGPGSTVETMRLLEGNDNTSNVKKPYTKGKGTARRIQTVVAKITRGALEAIQSAWEAFCAVFIVIKMDVDNKGLLTTLWERLIEKPFVALATPLAELLSEETDTEGQRCVSTFYGMELSKKQSSMVGVTSCFVAMAFGAIHFLSWNSDFLTPTHTTLWRISSIVMVAEPLGLTVGVLTVNDINLNKFLHILFDIIAFLSMLLGPIIYIPARICVLVLAFLTLRNLPPDAFQAISWTSYIPHF